MEGFKFPLHMSNNHLIGFVSLPGLGNEVRIANLSGSCRVKVKSLHHKLCLTELSLLQFHDPAEFINIFMRKRLVGGSRCGRHGTSCSSTTCGTGSRQSQERRQSAPQCFAELGPESFVHFPLSLPPSEEQELDPGCAVEEDPEEENAPPQLSLPRSEGQECPDRLLNPLRKTFRRDVFDTFHKLLRIDLFPMDLLVYGQSGLAHGRRRTNDL